MTGTSERPVKLTDAGNASRLIELFGKDYRWSTAQSAWLNWDGRRWVTDTKVTVVEMAKRVAQVLFDEALREPDSTERKAAIKWAMQTESASRIEAMVKLARSIPGVPVDAHEMDTDPMILVVNNGVLDLSTGQLGPHCRDRLVTKLAPVDYSTDADAPIWERFLDDILPDEDVREFLARWSGYCATGRVTEHKLVFALGPGSNGKGTLLNTLSHVLGDYASEAAPDLLMRRRDDPHPTGLADLHGARLVLATETGEGRRLDEPLVKRLTGGDRVKARHLYRDFFEFKPTHKFVIATNHRPAIEGTDHGIWRRIRLVPFPVVIPDDKADRRLEDKLLNEAPGILSWMTSGCLRWQKNGLTEPAAVTTATADYRADMDLLGEFMTECCVTVTGTSARASDLYDAYVKWAAAAGEEPKKQRAFGLALREKGLTKRTSNGVWWDGIGLRHGTLEPSEPKS